MEKGFNGTKFVMRAVLVLLAMEISLYSAGCCCPASRLSQCRLELKRLESVNSQHLTGNFNVGDNQGNLHLAAGYVHIANKNGNMDIIAAIEQEQAMLRYLVHHDNHQRVGFMACIPQDNLWWQGGFGNLHIYAEQIDKGSFCRKNH
ncbi:MAG: hypothetical protein MUP16_03190 [Sedimentisphaerales bacterium]|jgi:hypothetical protein|nr:hypothetical protein [Sedimentisphaerales bacterium]